MRGDKSSKILNGSALEKALAEKQFERPAMQLIGMVKASEKQNHISFAPAGCESWTDIPTAMVEEAEYVGHQACKGHSHPVFRLSLQESKDPMVQVLMGLLASTSQSARQTPTFATSPQTFSGGFPVGRGPREIGLGSIARSINDMAGHSNCQQMCVTEFGTSHPAFGMCTKLCDCVFWDGKNVYGCLGEILSARASAFER